MTATATADQIERARAELEHRAPAASAGANTTTEQDGIDFVVRRSGVAAHFVLALAAILLTTVLIGVLQQAMWIAPFFAAKLALAVSSAALGIVLVLTVAQLPYLGRQAWTPSAPAAQ
ncbi:hypothetical protein [Pseudoclavibacter soli]|uniref:hypothetical protein n=1 Tax=Pseudoclavibacter soli TaxID=452623 RepID=UPI00041CECA1|nr:hypothetical protein [Pseudoclavibacter soli]